LLLTNRIEQRPRLHRISDPAPVDHMGRFRRVMREYGDPIPQPRAVGATIAPAA
jgi:hypothetical protein